MNWHFFPSCMGLNLGIPIVFRTDIARESKANSQNVKNRDKNVDTSNLIVQLKLNLFHAGSILMIDRTLRN